MTEHQVKEWLVSAGLSDEEDITEEEITVEKIPHPQAATLVNMSNGEIIFTSNVDVCVNKEDQVPGKSNVSATFHGGVRANVQVMTISGNYDFYFTNLVVIYYFGILYWYHPSSDALAAFIAVLKDFMQSS
jgi:hypothetical protein